MLYGALVWRGECYLHYCLVTYIGVCCSYLVGRGLGVSKYPSMHRTGPDAKNQPDLVLRQGDDELGVGVGLLAL